MRVKSLVAAFAPSFALLVVAVAGRASADIDPTPSSTSSSTSPKRRRDEHARPKSGRDDEEPIKVGFLGSVGFPRPFAFEALLNIEDTVALGGEYSFLPSMNLAGVDVRYHAVAGDLRIFPLQSAFFFGARFGRQHLEAASSLTVAPYGTYSESMTIDTWFVNPRMGFLWTFKSGVSVGIDAGVQIPLSKSTSSTLPNGVQAPSGITAISDTLGGRVLPTVSLLQLGMMF